jgi:uncharacterized protein DUF4235
MLRRLLWQLVYGALAALATIVARRVAAKLWRLLTGEHPPIRRK